MKYRKKNAKNQLSHILNVANKVAFPTIELHIRKPPNDKTNCLLTGGGPCDDRTTSVLFTKEVGIYLAASTLLLRVPGEAGEGRRGLGDLS